MTAPVPDVQHFEGTIIKLVEIDNEAGGKDTVEVMSDNLYPGETLKSDAASGQPKKEQAPTDPAPAAKEATT